MSTRALPYLIGIKRIIFDEIVFLPHEIFFLMSLSRVIFSNTGPIYEEYQLQFFYTSDTMWKGDINLNAEYPD